MTRKMMGGFVILATLIMVIALFSWLPGSSWNPVVIVAISFLATVLLTVMILAEGYRLVRKR